MDTGRGASHTEVCWEELGEGQWGVGSWGEIAWGEMPDISEREEGSNPHCHVCTYLCNNPVCSSHVPQNLKCNKKKKKYIYIYTYIYKEKSKSYENVDLDY